MEKIYHVVGFIITWVIILFACAVVLKLLWELWLNVRHRIWAFQAFNTWRAVKACREWKRTNYKDFDYYNWRMIDFFYRSYTDKTYEHYQVRHLFRKRWIALFEEIMSTEQYKNYLKEKVENNDEE